MTTVTSTSASPPSDAATAQKGLSGNFDTFLKLLTAQLKNQDPLKPTDSATFTQQLATYSGVEQSIKQNKNLETLIGEIKTSNLSAATNYIGQIATANTSSLTSSGSGGKWSYSLGTAAAATTLTITNDSGVAVRSVAGNTDSGNHSYAWDGKDANGNVLAAGSYTLSIKAKTASDTDIVTSTSITDKVTAVDNGPSGLTVLIGNTPVTTDQITSVAQPASAANSITLPQNSGSTTTH